MNKEKLIRLAQHCQHAYGRESELTLNTPVRVKVGNDEAVISIDPVLDAIVVAIAGSNDRQDWWSNLKIKSMRTYHGRAHSGFYISAKGLFYSGIRRSISNPFGKDIIVTGHSRGGAMAHAIAHMMPYGQITECVTFGAPRVLKRKHNCKLKLTRVENHGDPVPHSVWALWGYRHFGKLEQIPHIKRNHGHDLDEYIYGLEESKS